MIYTVTLTPARDRTVVISNFEAGKVNRIKTFRDDPGGKGINVSKVVHALGGNTVAMGILGGYTGKYIQKSLNEMGIETRFTFVRSETRTNVKVYDDVTAVTTDINEPGAPVSRSVLKRVYNKLAEAIVPEDVVVFAGKLPQGAKSDLLAEWIAGINAKGARTILDADSRTLAEGVRARPFMIKPNDAELGQLCGRKLATIDEIFECAQKVLHENGIALAAVSLGADGALFVLPDRAYRAKGLKVNVKSTVGAGDAMTAALAYGMDTAMEPADAFRLSIACSAACVMCEGTQSASIQAILELYKDVEIETFVR